MAKKILTLPTSFDPVVRAAHLMETYGIQGYNRFIAAGSVQQDIDQLTADTATQGRAKVQTLQANLVSQGMDFRDDNPGAFSIDTASGRLLMTRGMADETQILTFLSPLQAPGVESHDAKNKLNVDHWYAQPRPDLQTPDGTAVTTDGRGIAATKGWDIIDGAANTTFDMRNVVAKSQVLTETEVHLDVAGLSRAATYSRTLNTYVPTKYWLGNALLDEGSGRPVDFWVAKVASVATVDVTHRVSGNDGNDTVIAGASSLQFNGGAGVDTMDYSTLANMPNGGSYVFITADAEAGAFHVKKGLAGNTFIAEEQSSVNLADGTKYTVRSLVEDTFGNGVTVTDVLTGVERIVGSNGGDIFNGGIGNDVYEARGGNDIINGGAGDDTFITGSGRNTVTGGAGIDTVDYSGFGDAVRMQKLTGGSSYIRVDKQAAPGMPDYLQGVERVIGTNFNDVLVGPSVSHSELSGGGGDDVIYGGTGNAIIDAGSGNNTAYAAELGTLFYGDRGNTRFVVGRGQDSFFFDAATGQDSVDARSSGDAAHRDPVNDLMYFSGTDAGHLRFARSGDALSISIVDAPQAMNVRVDGWYANGAYNTVSKFMITDADGHLQATLPRTSVDALVTAWATVEASGMPPAAASSLLQSFWLV